MRFFGMMLCICGLSLAAKAQKVIVGKVLAEKSKVPLSGAFVIYESDTARTDSLGGFILSTKAEAKNILVIAEHYQQAIITLREEQDLMLTIMLLPKDKYGDFVDDRKNKGMIHPDSIKNAGNDTSNFSGTISKINGKVIDADKGDIIPGVSIYMKEEEEGTATDTMGNFQLLFGGDKQSLHISALGYEEIDTVLSLSAGQLPVTIALQPLVSELNEVLVKGKRKGRYRNKNNQAVMLIKKVIDHKEDNRMQTNEDSKYISYDKMVFYVSNLPRAIKHNFLFRKFRFIFQNEDTAMLKGRKLLPMYVTENIADNYWSKKRQKTAKIMTSEKRMRFGSNLIESNNISSFLDRLYDQVDIYDNKIRVLSNFFLSPIAPAAPQFYKYYIVDTNMVGGKQVVQLEFEPRNNKDFLFIGTIFVTLDPDFAVTKIKMGIAKGINLNWTNDLKIDLDFEKQQNSGKYWQHKSSYFVNFGLFNSKRGAVGVRYTEKSDYQTNITIPDTVFKEKQKPLEYFGDTTLKKSNEFWEEERPKSLSFFEKKAYKNIDSLITLKSYKNMLEWGYVLGTGYKNLGWVELGSIYDLYSYNQLEGHKFRVGARTNIKKWQNFLLEGYAAYGLRDERFKYYIGGSYSLTKKYIYGFPMHYVKVSYQSDVRAPGQELGYATQEKISDIAKRGDGNRWIYNKLFTAQYNKELQNHMTFSLSYNLWQQEAAGNLYFTRASGTNDTIRNISTNEVSLNWRWSPREKFYQNKRYRGYISNGALAINVKATLGFNDGYGDAVIPYQRLDVNLSKTFFLAPFGEARMSLDAGYLRGNVPYPLLFIPQANQTYRFSVGAYNMMNFMEFASDQYVGLTVDYHLKGFILNRIPLVNKLKLREVFCFKALYGGIRNSNLPQFNKNLLLFPADANGRPIVNSFGNVPYIEASVGVENILQVLRIDFVKRFTYTNLPNAPTTGIRFSFGFDY
ncbi:hypothetical protein DBR32_09330 [Taibaiella sp. KBW10]|nr:hypothetical protein DBR32_09330 [Taibaiella sp. KBW10]